MRKEITNAGFSSYLLSLPDGDAGGQLDEFNHVNALGKLQIGAGDQGRQPVQAACTLSSTRKLLYVPGELARAEARKVPAWKICLDIVCIVLSTPIWLPLMLLLMLLTRVSSSGPVFYRQTRVGFGGRHFLIWKFRTMKLSAETETHERYFEELMRRNCPMTKLDNFGDPRLAPFGRILRASGLDELPQIFNVLCGEMSLVGPRPSLPNEFAKYEPWQRERVNGLPGLTGFWQVNGKNKTTFNEMIRMDVWYLNNMSILLDLKLMFKTGGAIIRQLLESRQPARDTLNHQTIVTNRC